VREILLRRRRAGRALPSAEMRAWPPANDRAGEANTVGAGFVETFFRRFGQLRHHRSEQWNADGRPAARDDVEVMRAVPEDHCRAVIPAVERVARIPCIALEI